MTRYKTINIKQNQQTVAEAIANLEIEIKVCKAEGIYVLKVIHGYGSSGVGGEIKRELKHWKLSAISKKQIIAFLPGEKLSDSNELYQKMKEICPELLGDFELYRTNPGLSLIWIGK